MNGHIVAPFRRRPEPYREHQPEPARLVGLGRSPVSHWLTVSRYVVLSLAIPLIARTRRTFVVLCLTVAGIGGLLTLLSTFVVGLGPFLFPVSLSLALAAGLAERERASRYLARFLTWLLVVAAAGGFAMAALHAYYQPSDDIYVRLSAPDRDFTLSTRLSQELADGGFPAEKVYSCVSEVELVVVAADLPQQEWPRLLRLLRARNQSRPLLIRGVSVLASGL